MTDTTHARPPLVSVVVVTLDNLELLRKCLASLQAQDHPNTEIIVVDNGSREPVLAALGTLLALGPRPRSRTQLLATVFGG